MSDRLPRHGTVGEYTKYACRCGDCREAQRNYMRQYRDRKTREKLGWSEEEWDQRSERLAVLRDRTIGHAAKLDLLTQMVQNEGGPQ